MQTFVPLESFEENARVLDYRRLGKQRVECLQILNALDTGKSSWASHPATLMWFGYEPALRRYMSAMIREWIRRGYNNTMAIPRAGGRIKLPDWWGGPIHSTHRAALLYKAPEHYSQFGWRETPELNYYWPTKEIST
ncbi:MSMEG_6728 family protein [[Eubacterium] cellulosolvens]